MSAPQPEPLLELADRVLLGARAVEAVEAFAVHGVSASVRAFDREVERSSSSESRGVGVRVVADGRQGFASTSDVSDDGLRWVLERARANAALGDPDDGAVLPEPSPADALPGLVPQGARLAGPGERVALVLELERLATGRDPRVSRVSGASYAQASTAVAVASTTGVRAGYARQDCSASVGVLAEDGEETQTGSGVEVGRGTGDLDLERCAQEAVTRAVRVLGATRPATAVLPVVLDPRVTSTFLGVVARGFSAEAVQKGRSVFASLLGEEVADTGLSVVDDGRLLDGPAAAPVDDEGVPTRRTDVVSGGVLRTFLHSTRTAARAGGGQRSTGSASRAGYGSSPGVGTTNLYLDGPTTPAVDVLRRGAGGVYVQEVKGVHSGVDAVSGEVSLGLVGFRVADDGTLGEPLREATLSGSLVGMLRSVDALGDDRRFAGGSVAGATLLLGPLSVAGT